MPTLTTFDPLALVVFAALNPVVMIVAFYMGMKADQWQKLIVAAFAASLAGFLLLYALIAIGIVKDKGIGGESGIVVLQTVFGFFWALAGYGLARALKARSSRG